MIHRKLILLVILIVALAVPASASSVEFSCTTSACYGTNQADTISGNELAQFFNGFLSNDDMSGFGGADEMYGGHGGDATDGNAGNDIIRAGCPSGCNQDGESRDYLWGGGGRDNLAACNNKADYVDGGNDLDVASVDRNLDTLVNVESWTFC